MRRRGGYRRDFMHRFARYDQTVRTQLADGRRSIWIHAVSVGELFVAFKFMEACRARFSDVAFVVTTTTSTGYALTKERLRSPDLSLYFPLDLSFIMRRALDWIRPEALICVEGELWPNLIRQARTRGIPVCLINGRCSERSYRGYRKLRWFMSRLLKMVNVLYVQSDVDRDRFIALGAPAERTHTVGSAKYEMVEPDKQAVAAASEALQAAGFPNDAQILLGGSTWPGEEEALIAIYKACRVDRPNLRLVLVPRHAERAPDVQRILDQHGMTYRFRRPVPNEPDGAPDVYVVNTTGELRNFYACADVIFVGKSLTQHGGQNVIEPAALGKPLLVGPNMENFPGVMADFLAADAVRQVPDAAALMDAVKALLDDAAERQAMGDRALALVRQQAGAVGRTVESIAPLWSNC